MFYFADVAIFGLVLLLLYSVSVCAWDRGESFGNKPTSGADVVILAFGYWLGLSGLFIGALGSISVKSVTLPFAILFAQLGSRLIFKQGRQNIRANSRYLVASLRSLSGLDLLLALYLAAVCLFAFVLTLAPPSGADWDSLMYHLAAPQQYLRHGHIGELPYDHHSYFPFNMEMLFLWGLALRGPVLAKLFHWLMLPLCCAALVAIGRRHLSLRAGLLAATLFASIPIVQIEATTAYIDLGLTAFTLLAYLCFANWKTTGDRMWLISCGVFCGFCLGTKYLGVLTFAWLGLWILGAMARERKWQIKPLLGATLLALLLGGGWYLRNYLWTGNPVYPFAYEIFDGKNWSLEMARQYTLDQKAYGFGRSWEDLPAAPWRVAMTPVNADVFINVVNGEKQGYLAGMPWWPIVNLPAREPQNGLFETQGAIVTSPMQTVLGPALLAFGLPVLFVRRKPWLIGFLGWSFAFYGLFWFFTGQLLRYLIPAFALWCLPCAWMAERFLQRGALLKFVSGAALVVWCLFALRATAWNGRPAFGVIFGSETPEDYLTRTFTPYPAMRWASQNTPEDARFAVYGEPRCFYLDRDYFWADDPHNNLIDYGRVRSGADLVKALRAQGATHVFWSTRPVFGGPPPGPMQDAIENRLLKPLFEARGCRVYRIAS